MRLTLYCILGLIMFFAGCAKLPPPTPVYQLEIPSHQISYMEEVKPVLVKRCVICHSCYNSPCQLKLSSWEGLERGASKEQIYNGGRLSTMEPSRLFVDAQTESQWRDRGFTSVIENENNDPEQSIFFTLLNHKRLYPEVSGNYYPEAADLACADTKSEVDNYLRKHPNYGMPFGFPPLEPEEYNIVVGWLLQGAKGPSLQEQETLREPHDLDHELLVKWESFLNKADPKYQMTARYLYEHLFLAHITFQTDSGDYYEMVRSRTGPGEEIDIIATVRPYDDPETSEFYYRFRKIHSTIVHKTHMVFPLGQKAFDRVDELFIIPDWPKPPTGSRL